MLKGALLVGFRVCGSFIHILFCFNFLPIYPPMSLIYLCIWTTGISNDINILILIFRIICHFKVKRHKNMYTQLHLNSLQPTFWFTQHIYRIHNFVFLFLSRFFEWFWRFAFLLDKDKNNKIMDEEFHYFEQPSAHSPNKMNFNLKGPTPSLLSRTTLTHL